MNKTFLIAMVAFISSSVALAEGRQQIRYLACEGQTEQELKFEYTQCVRTIESEVGYFNDCATHFQLDDRWLRQLTVNGSPRPSAFASVLDITDLSGGGISVVGTGVNDGLEEVLRIRFSPGSDSNELRVGNYENGEVLVATPASISCEIR